MKFAIPFCLAAAAMPAAAHADDSPSRGFGISATVPEVCEIDASTFVVDPESGLTHGSVFEMCNSGGGFRVDAIHRELVDGENVQISYAGEARQLDPSGTSAVAYRGGPILGNVPVAISSTGLAQALAISLSVTII